MSNNVKDLDRKRKEKELKNLSSKNNTSSPSDFSFWPTSIMDKAINSLKDK